MLKIIAVVALCLFASAFITPNADAYSGLKVAYGPCRPDAKKLCGTVKSTKSLMTCLTKSYSETTPKCRAYVSKNLIRSADKQFSSGKKIAAKSLKKKSTTLKSSKKSSKNSKVRSSSKKSVKKKAKKSVKGKKTSKSKKSKKSRKKSRRKIVRSSGSSWFSYLMMFGFFVLMPVSMYMLFRKISLPPWQALVPFYNVWVLLQEFDRPEVWNLYLLVPFLNIYYGYLVSLDLVRRFAKNDSFAFGVIFLPFVFLPMLAFGGNSYIPNYGREATDDGPDFSLKDIKKIMKSRTSSGSSKKKSIDAGGSHQTPVSPKNQSAPAGILQQSESNSTELPSLDLSEPTTVPAAVSPGKSKLGSAAPPIPGSADRSSATPANSGPDAAVPATVSAAPVNNVDNAQKQPVSIEDAPKASVPMQSQIEPAAIKVEGLSQGSPSKKALKQMSKEEKPMTIEPLEIKVATNEAHPSSVVAQPIGVEKSKNVPKKKIDPNAPLDLTQPEVAGQEFDIGIELVKKKK